MTVLYCRRKTWVWQAYKCHSSLTEHTYRNSSDRKTLTVIEWLYRLGLVYWYIVTLTLRFNVVAVTIEPSQKFIPYLVAVHVLDIVNIYTKIYNNVLNHVEVIQRKAITVVHMCLDVRK